MHLLAAAGVVLVSAAAVASGGPALQVLLACAALVPGLGAVAVLRGRSEDRDFLGAALLAIAITYVLAIALNVLAALADTRVTRGWVIAATLAAAATGGAVLARRGRRDGSASPGVPDLRSTRTLILLLPLPVAAVLGAQRLTWHDDPRISIAVVIALAVLLARCIVRPAHPGVGPSLYLVAVSTQLLGSMRGHFLPGIDMSREYSMLLLTDQAGRWSADLSEDAFNSALSITVLARHLHLLLDVEPQYAIRVAIPLLYALIPVIIFSMLRRHVDARTGVLGAAIFLCQPTFLEWSPIPGRQMVAMLLFAAIFYFLFRPPAERWRGPVLGLLAALLVLSHYSTTYLGLAVFAIAAAVRWTADRLRRDEPSGSSAPSAAAIGWGPFVVMLGCAVIWYGPVTGIGQNLVATSNMAVRALLSEDVSPLRSAGYAPGTSLAHQVGLGGSGPDRQALFRDYQDYAQARAHEAGYPTIQTREASAPITLLPAASAPTGPAATAWSALDTLSRMAMRLFLVIGLLRVVLGRDCWRTRRDWAAYAAAGGTVLCLVVVVPLISIEYDVGRTTQQLIPALALPMIAGGRALGRLATRRTRPGLADAPLVAALGALLVIGTGTVHAVTGATTPRMMLSNAGEMYRQVYVHPEEMAAARWLAQHREVGVQVASGYFSGTRLPAAGLPRPVRRDVFPWSIGADDYLFRGHFETTSGTAEGHFRGAYLNYPYPQAEIERHKDTVYANDYSRIYR